MLKVSDNPPTEEAGQSSCLSIDKKKRQVTLTESNPNAVCNNAQERGPMVSAPKMFAFDSLFTAEDPQVSLHSILSQLAVFLKQEFSGLHRILIYYVTLLQLHISSSFITHMLKV